MACPTCDHTMQNTGFFRPQGNRSDPLFLCPRCGTTKIGQDGEVWVPFLVMRAKAATELLHDITKDDDAYPRATILSVLECCPGHESTV